MSSTYKKWKNITDKMYEGVLKENVATDKLIELLKQKGTTLRPSNHTLIAKSYFVYNKDNYCDPLKEKPLGLGLVYIKPNKTKTQDIFIISPDDKLGRFYSEKEMIKKYPAMKGVHKNNLPVYFELQNSTNVSKSAILKKTP